MNLIHQKQSLVKPLSSGEGEFRRRLVLQICFLWRSGKKIFCPCLGQWEPHTPGGAVTYFWLRCPFSSWDSALISNKHLLLCWKMGFMQSWGNHGFRRASLLLPSISALHFTQEQQFCALNSFKSWQVPKVSKLLSVYEAISHTCGLFFGFFFKFTFPSLGWETGKQSGYSASGTEFPIAPLIHSLLARTCSRVLT